MFEYRVSGFRGFCRLANLFSKKILLAGTRQGSPLFRFGTAFSLLFVLLTNIAGAETITTVAGPGVFDQFGQPVIGDGGSALSAQLGSAGRIAIAPDGSIYISDARNNIVRKVLPDGIITTYAGLASVYGGDRGDGGPATSAYLNGPNALALDAAGNLYISDYGNYVIRKVAPDGIITTFIGDRTNRNSPDGSNGSSASIGPVDGMAFDSNGDLLIVSTGFHQIRKVSPGGTISTIAGNGTLGFSGDGGLAINATMNYPSSVAIDASGNLFIADTNNHRIRKINTAGVITTLAGNTNEYINFSGDGGPATNAYLYFPRAVAVDSNGNVFIADTKNDRVRKIGVNGIINTVAGNGSPLYNGDNIAGTAASLYNPLDVATAPNGVLFIADTYHGRIRKLSPSPPDAPVVGTAVAGSERAWLSFTAPMVDGGLAINGYTVTSSPAGGVDSQAGSLALNHEITGLNNGTTYTFTVTASNALGNSPASAASNSVTPNPYPGAPIIGFAMGGSSQATIAFSAPAISGSGPITGYTVTSFPAGGVDSNAGSTSLSHVVTGLTNGVTYTFTVKAQNASGFGPSSASSNSVTPISVPDAPSITSVVAGSTSVTVSLNAPANNGGNPISGYTVASSPANGFDSNAGSTSLTHVFVGLNNGTSYTFTATAKNAVGISAASAPSSAVTPATYPNPPSITNVTAGNAQASLVLVPPADNGGNAITGYTVTSFPAGGVDANAGTGNLSRTISGLVNGTAYTFKATATNSVGTSGSSESSISVTPATVPDPPIIGTASAANMKATVNFLPPSNNGGRAITGYTVTSSPAGGFDTNAGSTSLNHLVTGLTNGTAYTFTVKASNSLGSSIASAVSNSVTPLYSSPGLTVTDAGIVEGNGGTKTMDFTISLSEPSNTVVGFNIATSNGTATAGSDYVARSLSNQSIPIGATSATFTVTINGDATIEPNETFNVTVSNLTGATAANLTAVGTILNDDFSGGTITTIAGGSNGDGGPAINAYLRNSSEYVTSDSNGNVYIAETYQHRIRKITPAGIISTVAGTGESGYSGDGGAATSAKLFKPFAVAADASGNIYIADSSNNRIRKVTAAGIISTIAGTGTYDTTGDGGSAISASLAFPTSIVIGPSNSLYFVDGNKRVRKISSGGIISTVVGNGDYVYSGDGGSALSAGVNPYNIAVDSGGNIYITDHTNYRIRKVTAAGIISTIAGNGVWGYSGDGGPAAQAGLDPPYGIGVDSLGNITFSEYNSDRIRKIDTTGKINTIGGNGGTNCQSPGNLAACTHFYDAFGISIASDRSIYVLSGSTLSKIDLGGLVTKIAGGSPGETYGGYAGDGGPAVNALLNQNQGVATDSSGNVYIADTDNHRIRKIAIDGSMSTYAGTGVRGFGGDGQDASQALFNRPSNISVDSAGNVYVLDSENYRVRKISTAKIVTTIAGNGQLGIGAEGIAATSSAIAPLDITADGSGNLYLAEPSYGRIRKVSTNGVITTVAGNGTYGFSGDGGLATGASFRTPYSVDVDANGTLYIADRNNFRIRRVSPAGVIDTIGGTGVQGFSGDGAAALQARFNSITFVKLDTSGNLFVNDFPTIRKISNNGIVTTVVGNGSAGMSGDGGLATSAQTNPYDITVDLVGNIYFADSASNRVRKTTPLVGGSTAPGSPAITIAAAGDRSATVNIAAPASNGGSAISGYTVTSIPAGGVDISVGTTSLVHQITGLTNGVSYQFRVTAINAIGTSPPSGLSNAVIPVPLLSIANASVVEGNSGVRLANFTVSLSTPAISGGASFKLATADLHSTGNAASATSDYSAHTGTSFTIPAGQNNLVVSVKVKGDLLPERDEVFAVKVSNPVGAIIGIDSATGTIITDDNPATLDNGVSSPDVVAEPVGDSQAGWTRIAEIQGTDLISPFLGRQVRTRGVVTAVASDGFYLQSSDSQNDADPASSEAIFVFTGTRASVSRNNLLAVEGRVEEVRIGDSENQFSLTRIRASSYKLIAARQALPKAIALSRNDIAPTQSQAWLERYEAMLVSLPAMKVVGPVGATIREEKAESISDGIFYVTGANVAKPFLEPGINLLDSASQRKTASTAVFDGNPEIIRVDSGSLTGAAKISVDAGDYLANLKGIMSYGSGAYTLLPGPDSKPSVQSRANPRPATKPLKSEFTIGHFDLARLFDDRNNPAIKEPVLGGNAYMMRLAKTANAVCSYANNPDILGVSGIENMNVLTDLASAINGKTGDILYPKQCTADPHYLPYLVAGKPVQTTQGFLVSNVQIRPGVARTQVLAIESYGQDETFIDKDGSVQSLTDKPILLLRVRVNLKNGGSEYLGIVSVDWAHGAGDENRHRAQALYLATLMQARQLANPKEKLVVLGGFDAAQFSDGRNDILGIVSGKPSARTSVLNYVSSPLTRPLLNLTGQMPANERYSAIRQGNAVALDHVLINQALVDAGLAARTEFARINADFGEDNFGDFNVPLRSSGSDPLVLYLMLDAR